MAIGRRPTLTTRCRPRAVFSDGEAARLEIHAGLVVALEREIAARRWSQRAAARALGVSQPRICDLVRGRRERFTIDALIGYLGRVGILVRLARSRRRGSGRGRAEPVKAK